MRFTRDRWYSNEGQRRLHQRARSESMGMRRLISLTLLLMLILVVMQQLNEPKKYKPAFEAIGLVPSQFHQSKLSQKVPLSTDADGSSYADRERSSQYNTPDNASTNVSSSDSSDPTNAANRALEIQPRSTEVDLYMQMWLRLLATASPEAIHELAKAELSPQLAAANDTDEPKTPITDTPAIVLKWLDQAQPRVEKWNHEFQSMNEKADESSVQQTDLELGTQFVTQWLSWASLYRNGITLASSSLDYDVRLGFQLALDRRMLESIQDNSPWRPQERPVLARTLQRATIIANAFDTHERFLNETLQTSPIIEVNSLTKQAKEYRGQLVRIVGNNVTNPERTTQNIEGWGRFDYDVVWIRPLDGSQQPICIYSLRAPKDGWPHVNSTGKMETIANNKSIDMDAEDTPLVEISGILLKRIAYPSQRGIDVAPVLIASSVRMLPDGLPSPIMTSKPQHKKFRSRRWIEPNEQAENLRLLQDIFGPELESLADSTIASKLAESNFPEGIAREIPPLSRILYQLPRVSIPLASALATQKKIGPTQLGSIQAKVRSIKELPLRETSLDESESTSIFRLEMEPFAQEDQENASQPVVQVAFVNRIPSSWKGLKEVSQPATISGFFLDVKNEDDTTRYWIADHPDWSWRWLAEPSEQSETFTPKLSNDWKRLGAAGFDLSQADDVRNLRGKSLTSQESRAFYSLIDCSDRISQSTVDSTEPLLSAIDCLRERDPPYLRRVRAFVNIVRATRILVTEEQSQTALEGDAYYELDGLANLGNLSIQLKSADGKENVFFDGEFPITLIAKELPAWLGAESAQGSEAPATWHPRTTVEVEGFFYRLWSFNTAQTSSIGRSDPQTQSDGNRLKQIGPLVTVTKWTKPVNDVTTVTERSIVRDMLIAVGLSAIGIYVLFRLNQPEKRRKA